MLEMENIFFSGTFGGELLSLAAAKEVIKMHLESEISQKLAQIGDKISLGIEQLINKYNLFSVLNITGHPTWKFLNWSDFEELDASSIKTFFLQQMFAVGVLVSSTHNVGLTITDKQIQFILNSYNTVLADLSNVIRNKTLRSNLHAAPLKPIITLR